MFFLIRTFLFGFCWFHTDAVTSSQPFRKTTTASIDSNYRNLTDVKATSRIECGIRCARDVLCTYFLFDLVSVSCHLLSYDVSGVPLNMDNYLTWEVYIVRASCPDSKRYISEFDKCIVIHTHDELTWNEAQNYCQNDGGYLMTIDNNNDFDYFRELFSALLVDPQFFSLGAKKTGPNNDDFHWVFGSTVGDKIRPEFWHTNMPDNAFNDEFCIAARWEDQFYLNDVTCEWYPGYFICEYSV
ncbi:hypothetical protein RRG08_042993 [Elysia crispata]|uniref:C-type lectin domain-containing protein n=1 Tax=Elysia crispata TaxID=231223 RepID=A0AAE1CP40_9GAST|nr:hypothetical protein RRG08_042993 [Elysia crispata]